MRASESGARPIATSRPARDRGPDGGGDLAGLPYAPSSDAISAAKSVDGACTDSGASSRTDDRTDVGQEVTEVQLAGRPPGRRGSAATRSRRTARGREIVARQRLAAQVGVDQAQAAEAAGGDAQTADVGPDDLRRVADEHVRISATSIEEHADLTMQLRRQLGERARELGAHTRGGDPAPVMRSRAWSWLP